jgi:hypothetical protein
MPTKKSGGKGEERKIGRDAESGKFMSVADAQKNKKGAVVETIFTPTSKKEAPKMGSSGKKGSSSKKK